MVYSEHKAMIEILIPVLILGVVLPALTALVVLPFLIKEFVDFRRSVWIRASPTVIAAEPEALPPAVATIVGAARPAVEELGFRLAVIAHAPEFASDTTWTQVMLLDRGRGERAAIGCFVEGDTPTVALTFVVEFRNGVRLETDSRDIDTGDGKLVLLDRAFWLDHARRLYELHRRKVEESASVQLGQGAVMPAERRELEWIQDKAPAVTADLAAGRFELDQSGKFYRPTRKYAAQTILRNFKLTRAKQAPVILRLEPVARGFPVRPLPNQPRARTGSPRRFGDGTSATRS
jgi:hypothetical protein